jgi:hypothetical protein
MGNTNSQIKTKDTFAVSKDKADKVNLSFFGNQRETPFQVEEPHSGLSFSTISNISSIRSISSDLSDSSCEQTRPETPTSEPVKFCIPELPKNSNDILFKHHLIVERNERSVVKSLFSLYNIYCKYYKAIIHPKTLIVHDGEFILKISGIKREQEAKHSLSIYQHMSSLGLSEHFAQVYGYAKTENFVIEVHENAGIDLLQFIHNEDKEGTLRSKLQDSLLSKLGTLRSNFIQYGILYLDMKPDNLLVSKCTRTGQYILKLCDLGSLVCNGYTKTKTNQSGTLEWMSPELLLYYRHCFCEKNGLAKEQKAISVIHGEFSPYIELVLNSMDYSFDMVANFVMTGEQNPTVILMHYLIEIFIDYMARFNMTVDSSTLNRFRFRVLSSYYIIVERYGETPQNKHEIALELLAAMFPSEENSATKMLKNDPLYDKVLGVISF